MNQAPSLRVCLRVSLCAVLTLLATALSANAQTWTNLGPTGSEVPIVAVSRSSPSSVLAIPGNDNGGLFLTTNAGASWQSISAGLCDVHVTAMTFHPTLPTTIYVATRSAGVCRSTDGGATWTTLSSGLPVDSNGFPFTINAIGIDVQTPANLYVGTSSGANNGAGGPGDGIYRTTDAGATWQASGAAGSAIRTVGVSESTPTTAYASTDTGVFKTIDGGTSWNPFNTGLSAPLPEGALTVDPTNANIAYLTADGVFKTVNGGVSWAPINTGIGNAFFLLNVVVDPSNTQVLYLNAIGGCGLCKSTDGGANWAAAGATGLPSVPAFNVTNVAEIMAIDPVTPSRLYAGTPAGVFRSTDSALTWTEISTNLNPRSVTAPVLLGATPASLLVTAGSIDDGADILKLTGGSLPFSSVTSPLSTDAGTIVSMVVDPTDSNIIYALGGRLNNQNCPRPYKTTNGGTSWTLMATGIATNLCGNALTIDPSAPATLYLAMFSPTGGAAIGVYKTTTGGTTWAASSTGINFGASRVAISSLNPAILYAASGSQVFRSANSGANWSSVSAGLPSGGTFFLELTRVAIDPTDDNIVYAATGRGVFRTTNAGVSWTARNTGGWPSLNGVLYSADALAIDPNQPATIYAGLSAPTPRPNGFLQGRALGAGLFKSTDSGATWTSITELAGVIVNNIVFDGSSAIFATTNNGVFRFAAALPTMTTDRTALVFSAVSNGAAFSSKTAAQVVRITQTGTGTVTWTASSTSPWLVVTPGSGSGSATINVSVQFASGLAATQGGTVTLTFTGAGNTAGPINVTLNTLNTTTAVAPFGSFDTPATGTTGIAGSVPVTGWALDDVAVTRVRILRDSVAPEPAGAQIFIGDALFIDGARPDVQGGFPTYPQNTRAGWGYLMLTNFLPNGGNGNVTLYAYADDGEGHTTLLGSKVIGLDNAHATKPFGAIDTPTQGEVVCGSAYLNFGWALTQAPKDVLADSSTISAFVDGVSVGQPGQRAARSDINAAFPASDTTHAVGGLALDTTALTNGVHTIFWVVSDTGGQTDGIGSRFFTISNPCGSGLTLDPSAALASNVIASTATPQMPRAAALRMSSPQTLTAEINAAPADLSSIQGRRGFDLDAPLAHYTPVGGRITVQSEELDRIELHLLGGAVGGRYQYTGYLRTVAGVTPLPIGSSLDAPTGAFAWMPGVGFVGSYDLVFVRWSGGRAVARQEVRIVLNPKGSNRVGPQLVIDTPAASSGAAIVVGHAFMLAGWAADLASMVDAGVDTVHVWAYPVNEAGQREDPIFLGPAIFGNARPDVAAVYGDRFKESGYGMIVQTLAAGTYDIAVFAYSTVSNGFAPAKVVRVTVR
jgi:hypothetical protein